LTIDKPLAAPEETRYLGAMLSYAAVTDAAARVRDIAAIDAQIAAVVSDLPQAGSLRDWVARLHHVVSCQGGDFYTGRALEAPTAEALRDAVTRWSILHKRERWIVDRVPPGLVVELGMGRGGLAALKDKGCRLVGVDLSLAHCANARQRDYDVCVNATATRLPLADGVADAVVSCDVLGHVPADAKESLVRETHRVLKPGGQCLHVIETDEFDPARMPADEFARMVLVDGHLGIVPRGATEDLFGRSFEIIDAFMVSNAWMSLEHWLRAHDHYGANLPGELLAAMHNATPREREFFNLGVGWTFWQAFDARHESRAKGGTLFLHGRKRA
jgi:SAM-dependent methyltransferase